jgi:hypothetical protein
MSCPCDTVNMPQRKRIAWLLGAVCLVAAAPARAQAASPSPILGLRLLDQRVATIGFRLATANVDLCERRQWQPGFLVHDLSQYSRAGRAEAITLFKLGEGPAVLALAQGGPAQRAGLETDDVLAAADGTPLPRPPADAHDSFLPTERILDVLEAAFSDGRAELAIRRNGRSSNVRIDAVEGCASRFQVIPSRRHEAKADGRYVQLSSALVEFARDDGELAALLAHELAHNILRHRARLTAAGVERGVMANFGRSARLFRQTEMEADRWAVHLMDRAGFDPGAAVRLWNRQSRSTIAFLRAGTHPSWGSRIAAMEAEIEAIALAKARGEQARPPRIAADAAGRGS